MRLKIVLILLLFLFPKVCFAALDAAITWEIHTTGQSSSASINNGGGFKTGASGTDYSQGANLPANGAPILSLTDLACLDTSTTLTSATGGFTSAMVGNVIHIVSGTNFVVGWYEITVYTDTNTITIDRTAASSGLDASAGTGNVGGALALNSALDDDFFEALTAGNIVYISGGGAGNTHVLGEIVAVVKDGTAAAPIIWEGYSSSRGDNPLGTDRPLIAAGSNTFYGGSYYKVRNLRITSTKSGTAFRTLYYSIIENCKVTNSTVFSNKEAMKLYSFGKIINCEAICTNGYAIKCQSSSVWIIDSYLHDSVAGIYIYSGTTSVSVLSSIIDTCTTGILFTITNYSWVIIGNTIYGCSTGINATDSHSLCIVNNIIDACTTGASQTTEQKNNWWDYNCWDNTTDVSNVTKGDHAVTGDPGMTNPDNGDFTLGSGSNCLDAGMQVGTNQGATGDYKVNIGADQDDVSAAAGVTEGAMAVAF